MLGNLSCEEPDGLIEMTSDETEEVGMARLTQLRGLRWLKWPQWPT